jgi:hypothetical protein
MAFTIAYRTARAMNTMPKKIEANPVQVTTAAMRSNMLALTDIAGPEKQLAVKSRVQLGAGRSHCYGSQPTGCGVHDVTDVLGYEFKISTAHRRLLLFIIPVLYTAGNFWSTKEKPCSKQGFCLQCNQLERMY